MIPAWAFITQIIVYAIGVGAVYGVVSTKLNYLTGQVDKLMSGNENSKIIEERQSIINKNVDEKLEVIADRLDVHGLAIKTLESEVVKITTKCSFHNDPLHNNSNS